MGDDAELSHCTFATTTPPATTAAPATTHAEVGALALQLGKLEKLINDGSGSTEDVQEEIKVLKKTVELLGDSVAKQSALIGSVTAALNEVKDEVHCAMCSLLRCDVLRCTDYGHGIAAQWLCCAVEDLHARAACPLLLPPQAGAGIGARVASLEYWREAFQSKPKRVDLAAAPSACGDTDTCRPEIRADAGITLSAKSGTVVLESKECAVRALPTGRRHPRRR